jgi:transcription initiation factor TFIIB
LELSSDIKSNAERITINALENGLARGRTIIGIVAASIFYTCKKNRNITLNEIISQIEENLRGEKSPRKHVYRCYKALFQELGLQSHTIDPVSYIPRYVSDLGIDESIVGLATKFIQEFTPHINTSGKDPKAIAAAAIYIVCKIKNISIYQEKIAKIAGVTGVTLRSRMKEFYTIM